MKNRSVVALPREAFFCGDWQSWLSIVMAKITSKRKEKKLKLAIEDKGQTPAVSINPNAQLAEIRRRW